MTSVLRALLVSELGAEEVVEAAEEDGAGEVVVSVMSFRTSQNAARFIPGSKSLIASWLLHRFSICDVWKPLGVCWANVVRNSRGPYPVRMSIPWGES